MIDPTKEIRTYYITLLSGISVSVFNVPTLGQEPPFVIVSSSSQETGTKTDIDHQVTTTFDIVVKTDGDWGGDALAEDIAAEFIADLKTSPYGSTTNFEIITCMIESSDPIEEITETGRVIRKVITVNNYVSQL